MTEALDELGRDLNETAEALDECIHEQKLLTGALNELTISFCEENWFLVTQLSLYNLVWTTTACWSTRLTLENVVLKDDCLLEHSINSRERCFEGRLLAGALD